MYHTREYSYMSSTGDGKTGAPDIEGVLAQLQPSTRIKHEEMSLTKKRSSIQVTIMADARNDAGIDINNPGTVDEYYYRDFGVVLIDLEGRFANE